MAWFQWRKCGNMIPNVQHQLYQLYNRHWTQPYHEYQTSHVISMITPLWLVVSIGFTALFFGWQTIHGRYWRRLVRLHLPSKATSQQVYEALVNAAQNPEGSKAAGGWLVDMDLPWFTPNFCDNFMHFWWGNWQLAVNLRLPLGFDGILGFLIFPIMRRTWKPYVQNSSSSFSSMWSTTRNQSSPIRNHLCTYTLYLHHHIISIMNHHILGDGLLRIPDSRKCWDADLGPCGFIFLQALRFFA